MPDGGGSKRAKTTYGATSHDKLRNSLVANFTSLRVHKADINGIIVIEAQASQPRHVSLLRRSNNARFVAAH